MFIHLALNDGRLLSLHPEVNNAAFLFLLPPLSQVDAGDFSCFCYVQTQTLSRFYGRIILIEVNSEKYFIFQHDYQTV